MVLFLMAPASRIRDSEALVNKLPPTLSLQMKVTAASVAWANVQTVPASSRSSSASSRLRNFTSQEVQTVQSEGIRRTPRYHVEGHFQTQRSPWALLYFRSQDWSSPRASDSVRRAILLGQVVDTKDSSARFDSRGVYVSGRPSVPRPGTAERGFSAAGAGTAGLMSRCPASAAWVSDAARSTSRPQPASTASFTRATPLQPQGCKPWCGVTLRS